jgi:nitrite reductase (NO-forming)/hydroxylamine reductase
MTYGTEGGMPNFDDILSKKELADMAKYVQMPADVPPEWGMKDMKASWKLVVPVAERPTKQMNDVNLKNVFAVTLRDSGEVALIDGDTKEDLGYRQDRLRGAYLAYFGFRALRARHRP